MNSIQLAEPVELFPSRAQAQLIATKRKFPALVAGFGSGKTDALVSRALHLKFQWPQNNIGYYLPTYDLVAKIAYPRFEERLAGEGHKYKINKNDKEIIIQGAGKFIFRTMDSPGSIIGYEVGDSLVDELDTLKEDDARLIWQKILSRNRQKKTIGFGDIDKLISANTIAVGTTPEGFRFVYKQWYLNKPSDEYELIRASTYSNARNLPDDYIQNLIDAYPTNLISAYIEGEFVNLTSGSVYPNFSRTANNTQETIQAKEPLHVGMDFNVGRMSAIVCVPRNGNPYALTELIGLLDTPAMIIALKARFPNNIIFVYPDSSGDSRKSVNASISDIALLKQAGFHVLNNPRNPFVKDRVLSVNAMLDATKGSRLKVNVDLCPALSEALEKQAYDKKGEPDKTSGLDHAVDALGYFVAFRFPIIRNRMTKQKVGGI